ncbi:hypothetical protein FGG69_gp36 [Salinibacter phage SRUTV-1]|uniref:Uncharacterized protein n=1 Tax=Salinibacter phage SRUTV-1 TaxID=2684227 RepID=A0A2D3FAM5_9CAUD|nr:hypothetical protein FGG69_gp36 [Salinibacter phage SRUTV-1]ATU47055.1 hypothetical protein [Salinibacter phage SRUTV-1]
MIEPDLSPCPNCEHTSSRKEEETDERVVLHAEGTPRLREWQVRCRNCGMRGPFVDDANKAVFKWNAIDLTKP